MSSSSSSTLPPTCEVCGAEIHTPSSVCQCMTYSSPDTVTVTLRLCEDCLSDNQVLRKVMEVQFFLECVKNVCPSAYTQDVKRSLCSSVFLQVTPPPPPPLLLSPLSLLPSSSPPPPPSPLGVDPQSSSSSSGDDVDLDMVTLTAQDLLDHIRDMESIGLRLSMSQ